MLLSFANYLTERLDIPATSYGYWITAAGKVLPVGQMMHDEVAIKNGITDRVTPGDTAILKMGWVRIVAPGEETGSSGSIEIYVRAVTFKALSMLKQYVKQLDGPIFIDAMGANVSNEFANKAKALQFLNTIKPKVSRQPLTEDTLPDSYDYGYWIDQAGHFNPVMFQDHSRTAANLLGCPKGAADQIAFRKGWIKITGNLETTDPYAIQIDFAEDAKISIKTKVSLRDFIKQAMVNAFYVNYYGNAMGKSSALQYINKVT